MLSVTDSSTPIIFCEGLKDGLDPVFLHQIIPPGQAEIRPVGGKLSMRAFIEGYLTDSNQSNYIGFRDRDFDVEPPASPQLIRLEGKKPIFMTYRASIESYLIEASLLHKYWAYHAENSTVWKYGSPPPVITIETLIENAARQLADYQAIRWALAKLKPGQRWPEIRTTWMKGGSGHLPTSLTYDNCLLKANNLVDKFFTEVSHVDQTKLATYASHFRQIFATEDFYAQQAYLVWFHGKDLFKQVFKELQLYLHSQKIMSDFPKDKYLWWAAANFEASRHPDLQALLSQLAI